jgi:hypothetical protein
MYFDRSIVQQAKEISPININRAPKYDYIKVEGAKNSEGEYIGITLIGFSLNTTNFIFNEKIRVGDHIGKLQELGGSCYTLKEFDEYKIESFFHESYTYEASFVFDYYDENGNKVSVNIANDVYRESRSLDTRIFLRVMVTVLPIIIALLSYYIQNKKFIVNEEYYDNTIKEIENRKMKD